MEFYFFTPYIQVLSQELDDRLSLLETLLWALVNHLDRAFKGFFGDGAGLFGVTHDLIIED